jgi:hypothetical protein
MRGRKSASFIRGAAIGISALSIAALSAGAPSAQTAPPLEPVCDEYDPSGPARIGEVTLDATDFADRDGTRLLSFVETESIGKVDVEILSASPAAIVRGVSAVPGISAISPDYGERLKGIKVAVFLRKPARPIRVVLKLRQVCARRFRNTFLYY